MYERKGVLVVPVDHPLQPSSVAEDVHRAVRQVIGQISSIFHISEKSLYFKIEQFSNSSKSIVSVLESITGDLPDRDQIRVLFSDKSVPEEIVTRFLSQNQLVVVAEESGQALQIKPLGGAVGCRVSLPSLVAQRFIEDVFVDIFMGRWMTQNPVFLDVMSQYGGLPGFFREKARFFKKNIDDSYVGSIVKDSGYAPLAALNRCSDKDFEGRARATMETWRRFQSSLSGEAISSLRWALELTRSALASGSTIDSIPIFGKQLPVSRIERVASRLPDGSYTLLVLRRASSVRKNPKTREKISSIFGKGAKINSFRFIASAEFSSNRDVIKELMERRFVEGLSVSVSGFAVTIAVDTGGNGL